MTTWSLGSGVRGTGPTRAEREAAERAIHGVLERIADRMGDEQFELLIMDYLAAREAELRAQHPSDHPALQLLDEWRRDGKIE